MQFNPHSLFDKQFRIRTGMFVHVVRHATHLRRAVLLPLAFRQTRDVRVRQVHFVTILAVHHQLLLAVLLEQVGFAQVQNVGQGQLQRVVLA